jgi:nicotinate-nucleotide adenylyltransferase
MRIGIYGSSLDPITNGHLWSANTIAEREELDKIIFLPSSNKRIDKDIKVNDKHRVNMLELAIKDNPKFEYDTYEMEAIAGKQYSVHTMRHFKEVYPNDELFFLLGADLLADLPKWIFGEEFIKENKFIVIERNNVIMHKVIADDPLLRHYQRNFTLIYKGIVNEISSKYIRDEFAYGGSPRYLMPEAVYNYIVGNKLYIKGESKCIK